nr:uncharacterized protein LOC109148798 [Ipomoea batatas]
MLLGGNVNFADWIAGQMKTLDEYSVCLLLTICWKIWEARNQKLWRNLRTDSRTITEDAISFLHAWRNIHPDSCIRAQLVFVDQGLCQDGHGRGVSSKDSYVSAIGDPIMRNPNSRFALEAWNFCNEVGEEAPNLGSRRLADCVDLYFPTHMHLGNSVEVHFKMHGFILFGALPMMPIQAMTEHYQATRHARRVYVGGLPPNANEQFKTSLFLALIGIGLDLATFSVDDAKRLEKEIEDLTKKYTAEDVCKAKEITSQS